MEAAGSPSFVIVHQIATAHAGTVEVRSSPDEGAAFTVTIPVSPLQLGHALSSPDVVSSTPAFRKRPAAEPRNHGR